MDGANDSSGVITQDYYGRPTQTNSANGAITNISYTDATDFSTVRSTPPIGPTTVVRTDWKDGYVETYTVQNSSTFNASNPVLSLSVTYVDAAGRTVSTRAYYSLTGVTEGVLTTGGPPAASFYTTSELYDTMGRVSSTTDESNTTTRTQYTLMGWVSNVSMGSKVVTQNVYDNGTVGDGNLTQVTRYPYYYEPDQTTTNYYNWQDQLQASSNGISLTYSTLDNLGEVTSTAVYDLTTPVNSSPTTVSASGGEVNVNANMGMRALSDSYRAGSC